MTWLVEVLLVSCFRLYFIVVGYAANGMAFKGPALSKLGLRVVDVGTPMLSMHSIRETSGSADVDSYINLFGALFEGFANLDKSLQVDAA